MINVEAPHKNTTIYKKLLPMIYMSCGLLSIFFIDVVAIAPKTGTLAYAQIDHDLARGARLEERIRSLDQLLFILHSYTRGEVLDIHLYQLGQTVIYELIILEEGSKLERLWIDAQDGKIVDSLLPK